MLDELGCTAASTVAIGGSPLKLCARVARKATHGPLHGQRLAPNRYVSDVHPDQPWLPDHVAVEWLPALADAGVAANTALLLPLSGGRPHDAAWASTFPLGMPIGPDEPDHTMETIDWLNVPARRNSASRVTAWLHGMGREDVAAILRHEAEHIVQFTADPGLQYVYFDCLDLLRGREGSGKLYQCIPAEADANAAAVIYVRKRFTPERIVELAAGGSPGETIFRAPPVPPDMSTLAARMDAALETWATQFGPT